MQLAIWTQGRDCAARDCARKRRVRIPALRRLLWTSHRPLVPTLHSIGHISYSLKKRSDTRIVNHVCFSCGSSSNAWAAGWPALQQGAMQLQWGSLPCKASARSAAPMKTSLRSQLEGPGASSISPRYGSWKHGQSLQAAWERRRIMVVIRASHVPFCHRIRRLAHSPPHHAPSMGPLWAYKSMSPLWVSKSGATHRKRASRAVGAVPSAAAAATDVAIPSPRQPRRWPFPGR